MAFMALMGGSLLEAVNHDNQLGDLLGGIPVVGQTLGDITNTTTSIFGGFEKGMMSMTGGLLGGLTGGMVGDNWLGIRKPQLFVVLIDFLQF